MPEMKPILFNTDMVRAILDNRKTVTRRVVKPQPPEWIEWVNSLSKGNGRFRFGAGYGRSSAGVTVKAPYCHGNILYVRETFFKYNGEYVYRASAAQPDLWNGMWNPSIHMPREAARIFLRVTGVRVERLQDITDDGAFSEGALTTATFQSLKSVFRDVWTRTIKKADRALYGWDANPWVWVIEFERISREEAENGLQRADVQS